MNQNNQYYSQPTYNRPVYQQPVKKTNGVGIAALICGIFGFFINPLYLISVTAVILGIVGLCLKDRVKGTATAGLILGICAGIVQFIVDLILSVFTFGLSFFI